MDDKQSADKKKDKKEKETTASSSSSADKDGRVVTESGDVQFSLGGKKKISISKFKGTTYIGIREYYTSDGKELPSTNNNTHLN
jgi:hypothetical protein